jgi:hypothetical protein
MDVRQQIVPTDDVAASVTQWETARHEPAIFTIGPTEAMFDFVRQTGLYGMLPGYDPVNTYRHSIGEQSSMQVLFAGAEAKLKTKRGAGERPCGRT